MGLPEAQRGAIEPTDPLAAYRLWVVDKGIPSNKVLEEAFMAGVAWWQRQTAVVAPAMGTMSPAQPEEIRVHEYLYLTKNGGDLDLLEEGSIPLPVLNTILAALAFYRDHTLSYGTIPGQLSAKEVSDLIQRLQPEERAQ